MEYFYHINAFHDKFLKSETVIQFRSVKNTVKKKVKAVKLIVNLMTIATL